MQPWFPEAKLGIFVHWGIYAVRGVAESWSFFGGDISHEQYMEQLGVSPHRTTTRTTGRSSLSGQAPSTPY